MDKIMTKHQMRMLEEQVRSWTNLFSDLRYNVISSSTPKKVIISNDGLITYKYSYKIEMILRQIDKLESEKIDSLLAML